MEVKEKLSFKELWCLVIECCREVKGDEDGLGKWETTGDPTETI